MKPHPQRRTSSLHHHLHEKKMTNTMIIDYSIDSKHYYEKVLDFKGTFYYDCPICNASHSFHRHGTYERNLVSLDLSGITEEKRLILRVLCTSCGHTHAILPWDIIPFREFSATSFLQILKLFYCDDLCTLNIASLLCASFQVVYFVLKLFQDLMHNIQLFLRFALIFKGAKQPTPIQCLHIILDYPKGSSAFFLDYLCYHHKPLFMNRKSTSSYPIYISFPRSQN